MKLARYIPPWAWIVLIILYILSPVDLIPDVFGLPARLDDLLVALLGAYYYKVSRSRAKGRHGGPAGRGSRREGGSRSQQGEAGKEKQDRAPGEQKDPHVILGVKRDTPTDEVKKRYREKLLEYHPDRVQHLGREIQELAEKRTRDINDAYQAILRQRGEEG